MSNILESSIQIISPVELLKIKESVTIVDVRNSGFFRGHITQSQSISWADFTQEKPGFINALIGNPSKWGQVQADHSVETRLRKLGLSHNRMIVVVGTPAGWGEDGRIAWNLLYWGAEKVALLDGGYPAWKKLGYPIEFGSAKPATTGDFALAIKEDRRAHVTEITDNLKSQSRLLLDARSVAEFEGKSMPGQKRGGQIPGARLIEFEKLYQLDGKFISANELKKMIGEDLTQSPITYCTGGVRSALLAVLIEARLGVRAANYDASMWEWSRNPELPIERVKLKIRP